MKLRPLALCGDGPLLACAPLPGAPPRLVVGVNHCLRVLALEGGRALGASPALPAGEAAISALATSPAAGAEAWVAVGHRDGRLALWSLADAEKPLAVAEAEAGGEVFDLAWRPPRPGRGPELAAALASGEVLLWSPERDGQVRLPAGPEACLSVDWFPDGEHLAAGGEDGVLRIFRLPAGAQAEGGLLRHHAAIRRVRVSRCGRYVAYLSEDERGGLFDLANRTPTSFGRQAERVRALAWHPARPALLLGTEQGRAARYDVPADALEDLPLQHLHPLEAVCFDAAGGAWTAGRDGKVHHLPLDPERLRPTGPARCLAPRAVGYALSVAWVAGGLVAAGYSSGALLLWDPSRPEAAPAPLPAAHGGPVYGLAARPDGRALASGAVDRALKVHDVPERLLVHDLREVHRKPIYGVAWSPDGRLVATGSGDTYLAIYDVEEAKRKAQERFGQEEYYHFAVQNRVLNCVAWSPDGRRLAVGLSNHSVVILQVSPAGAVTKGPTLALHEDAVSEVAWTPDGAGLLSAGYDRRLVLWDASTWRPRAARLTEHAEPIQALAAHPGRPLAATGGWDESIRLWRLPDLEPLGQARAPHFSAVEGLAFEPGGGRLASAGSDGLVVLWALEEG